MNRIMLVDDEPNILRALQRVLTADDREIEVYTQPGEALRRAQVAGFDLFLSDYRMRELDGVQFLSAVKGLQPDAMRIILSGYTELDALLSAINQAEIYRFICKPWQDEDLRQTVRNALDYRHMLLENRYLAEQVRRQQGEIERNKGAFERLAAEHPELTHVNWAADGSILLDDDEA